MTKLCCKEIRHCKQPGFTLIEILIALVIGTFIIGGVIQLFSSSKQSSRMLNSLARMQENGRFAMEFIVRDIRMMGFKTCLSETIPTALNGTNDNGLNASDSLSIQMSLTTCPLVVSTFTYSINNDGAGGQASLFKKTDVNPRQELVEGIENMQILYGADINDDKTPDYYVSAGTAGLDMNQVVSIRITLSAFTLETNLSTTGDGRLRRTFTSIVAVRNRLP